MEHREHSVSVDSLSKTHFLHISNHSEKILSGLEELRSNPIFTDAILCAGSNEYPCHRAVLASSSPYFKAMFSSPLKESHDNRVSFNDMSNAALSQIINFIYTGQAEINYENAQDLLAAASLLQYHEVVEACCDFLKCHLHSTNCLGIEWFSHLHSLHQLELESQQYAIENFDSVIESDEFLQLSPERLCWYLACSNIDVSSEEKLYEAAVQWSGTKKVPESIFCQIFSLIRFNFLSPTFLSEVVSKTRHFESCERCLALIKFTGVNDIIDKCSEGLIQNSLDVLTPRPSTLAKEVLVMLGTDIDSGIGVVETFDPAKERWMCLTNGNLPCSLVGVGIKTIGNDIFVTGGIRREQVLSEVWCFVSQERRWMSLPSLLEPRAYHSCTSWNCCLYVLGGMGTYTTERRHAQAIETVECLDLNAFFAPLSNNKSETSTNLHNSVYGLSWKVVSRIPCPRIGSSAVTIDGAIIEVGGTQYGIPIKKLESYRCLSVPQSSIDQSFKHPKVLLGDRTLHMPIFAGGEQFVLPEIIEKSQIVVVDGQLYIYWEDSKKFISLNPTKRIFKDLARPCTSRSSGVMTVIGSKIYLVGSSTDPNFEPLRVIECYDTAKNTWVASKHNNKALNNVHCVTIKI